MQEDTSKEVTSLNRYLQDLTLDSPPCRKLIDQALESGYGSSADTFDAVESMKKPLDFKASSTMHTGGRYELFGNSGGSTSPILLPRSLSSNPHELSDDGRRLPNLLPRPATAGSPGDYHRSPLAFANSLENCLSDTGLARATKYQDQCFLDRTCRYLDSLKATWNDMPPPGISSPTLPANLWDDAADNCCINGNSGYWMPAVTKLCQHVQQGTQQRQAPRRFDYRGGPVDFSGGQPVLSPVNRPLRSQRVDIRILYAMMYRALANGLAGGRREVCVFCRNNGEHELIYTSHSLKDNRNRVTCPILRAYQCPICLSTGDKAHTIKYCPYNTDSNVSQDTPLEKLFRYVHGQQPPFSPFPPAAGPLFDVPSQAPPVRSDSSVDVADLLVNLLQSNSLTTVDSGSLLDASRLFR